MGVSAALLLMGAGVGMQAYGMVEQGKAAKAQARGEEKMAERNQAIAEQNAKATELKTGFDQRRQIKAGQRVMGTLRANLGASGAVIDEGAPLDLLSEQGDELALENALIGHEGQVRAGQYRSQAVLFGMEADLAGIRKGSAMKTAMIGAAGTVLTGFGTAAALGMGGGGGGGGGNTKPGAQNPFAI